MAAGKSFWDIVDILGKFLIPIVVGLLGWQINSTLKDREVKAQYVELAVRILQEPDTTVVGRELRSWATTLLVRTSPVAVPTSLQSRWSSGAATFPGIRLLEGTMVIEGGDSVRVETSAVEMGTKG